jgi:hypothetical protein
MLCFGYCDTGALGLGGCDVSFPGLNILGLFRSEGNSPTQQADLGQEYCDWRWKDEEAEADTKR